MRGRDLAILGALGVGAFLLARRGTAAAQASQTSPAATNPLQPFAKVDLSDPNAYQVIDIPGLSGRNFFESPANLQQGLAWLAANYQMPTGAPIVTPYSGFLAPYGAQITFQGQPYRLLVE